MKLLEKVRTVSIYNVYLFYKIYSLKKSTNRKALSGMFVNDFKDKIQA